jgi:hypothetical protein
MIGYKITPEQADTLRNTEYAPSSYYNPVQDINGDWYIFETEYISSGLQIEQSEYIAPL